MGIKRRIVVLLLIAANGYFSQMDFIITDSSELFILKHRLKRQNSIPEAFINEKLDWKNIEVHLSNSEKDEYLKKIVGNNFFPKPYDIVRTDYHLIDFNGDQLLDMIYAGREPSGGEKDNYAFFENRGDSLYLSLKMLGTMIEVSKDSHNAPISFVAWEWPCCAEQMHYIHYYKFYPQSDIHYNENKDLENYTVSYGKYQENYTLNFILDQTIRYIKSTLIPDSININTSRMLQITSPTILQTNPEKTLESKLQREYIQEDFTKSIEICKLNKDQQATVLSELIFRNEHYYFIKLSIDQPSSDLNFNRVPVKNLLGWVSGNHIKILEN